MQDHSNELHGASPLALVHADDRALVEENLNRRLSGEEETSRYEARFVRKDGKVQLIGEVFTNAVESGGLRKHSRLL